MCVCVCVWRRDRQLHECWCGLLLLADSTVLAHLMTLLNTRHDYGLDLFLLSVDEGITGYRDDSLEVRWYWEPAAVMNTFSLVFVLSHLHLSNVPLLCTRQ